MSFDWVKLIEQSDPANILVGVIAAVGLGVTVFSIREQTRNSRLEKIADVLMDCTRRFGDLITLRYSLESDVRHDGLQEHVAASRYFQAYWNLQWDQYNFFRLGLLPREILTLWFVDRITALARDEHVMGVSFKDGWTEIGRRSVIDYTDFVRFVDMVWGLTGCSRTQAIVRIDQALQRDFRAARSMRVGFTAQAISR